MYTLLTLLFIKSTLANQKFNWGPCKGWPVQLSDFDSLEKKVMTDGAPFSHLDRATISKNKHEWAATADEIKAQCTNGYTVPQDWNDIEEGQMDYFISKFLANPDVEFKGRLWILNGGPGGSGQELWSAVPFIWKGLGGAYDLYLPDHRGTGNSSQLMCPTKMSECPEYVTKNFNKTIRTYTVQQAASDVILSVTLAKTNDPREAPTYIYGLSYGTYWLNRIIEEGADIADAYVLDGICPSSLCRIATYDVNGEAVGEVFMKQCGKDPFCAAQFGNEDKDPYKAIADLADDVSGGNNKCAAKVNLTRELFSQINFGNLESFFNRVVLPPLVKRMMRCDDDDLKAIEFFYKRAVRAAPPAGIQVLELNILLSEMFDGTDATEEPPSAASLHNLSAQAQFATYQPELLRPLWDGWPRYIPLKRYYNKYAFSDKPILLMNGDLDPQTPHYWAASAYSAFKLAGNAHVNFVTVPRSVHCTVFGAPTNENGTETCGLAIMKGFLDSEGEKIDTECTEKVLPIDWKGTSYGKNVAKMSFNTTDLWGK